MIPFTKKDKKIHWRLVVTRKFSPFYEYIFSIAAAFGHYKAILGYEHSYRRMNIDGDLFYCQEDIFREKEQVSRQAKNNIKLVFRRPAQAEREGGKLMSIAYKIRDANVDGLTNHQIQKILLKFCQAFYCFIPFLMMPINLEGYLEKELDKYLNKKYKSDKKAIEKAKSVILTPSRENLQEQEQLSILKMAGEFIKTSGMSAGLGRKIKTHLDKFGVLGLRYGIGDLWRQEEIIQRIKSLSGENPLDEREKLIQARRETQKKLAKIIKELKPDQRQKQIIKIIRDFIYLRTYRTNILNNAFGVIKPFLEKVARRLGIDWDALNYMILPEIVKSLELKRPPAEFLREARKRKIRFATIFINGRFFIFTGKEIPELISFWGLEQKIPKQDLIRGVVANPGRVEGIARILYTPADNKKVKKGDILVASMTTPNFIPAMEKAGAFVTDEGGILCHAAIVSREMNKPCLIGTKIATAVLHDGDFIEVDAHQGVVKKIK